MNIRPCTTSDLNDVLDATLEIFGPFYEQSFRAMVPSTVYEHQHGTWADDYRSMIPTLLDPEHHKYVALSTAGEEVVGYVAWSIDLHRRHGVIEILGVRAHRRSSGAGRALCEHAFASMRHHGVEVIEIGTGGDDFHAPARRLYESLGFSLVPVAAYLRTIDQDNAG